MHFKALALDRNLSLDIAEQDNEKRKEVYLHINDLYSQIVASLDNSGEAEKKEIDSVQRVLAEVLNSWAHHLLWSKDGDVKSNLLNSEEHYCRSIEIKKALEDLEGQAISNGGLGFLWQNKRDFVKAIEFFF